ncbi:MAG: hypothetical protein GDA46_02475 [Bdellovibrionales bacterium]|nr:hypothetical protein [Bdellovibrionales bacterium]
MKGVFILALLFFSNYALSDKIDRKPLSLQNLDSQEHKTDKQKCLLKNKKEQQIYTNCMSNYKQNKELFDNLYLCSRPSSLNCLYL